MINQSHLSRSGGFPLKCGLNCQQVLHWKYSNSLWHGSPSVEWSSTLPALLDFPSNAYIFIKYTYTILTAPLFSVQVLFIHSPCCKHCALTSARVTDWQLLHWWQCWDPQLFSIERSIIHNLCSSSLSTANQARSASWKTINFALLQALLFWAAAASEQQP